MSKKNNRKYIMIKRVLDMARPYKKNIVLIIILSIIINFLELSQPYLIKILIDKYMKEDFITRSITTISLIGYVYIVIVIVSNLLDLLTRTISTKVGENVVYNLRNKLFRYIEYANISFHDSVPSGKLFVRITNDTEDISTLFKDVVVTIFKDALMIVIISVIMFIFNVKLTLVSFIVLPFLAIFSYFITTKLNSIYTASKNIRTKLNTFLSESIYGIQLIKVFNRQKEKIKEWRKYTLSFYNSRKPTAIFEALLPAVIEILKNLGITLIVVASINKWFKIEADVSMIYIFITYLGKLFTPIINIIENIETVQESVVSINKIYEILEIEDKLEDFDSGKYISNFEGKIEFKNVWFAYKKDDWVLKDVSFTILPKQSIALVGKTGSGKTTITNLINRFYDIQRGEILIDGINIKEINKRALRKNIGTILQDPFIFAKSIKENIKLYSLLSDETVKKVLKLSSSDTFVDKLPNKADEIASERGSSFSVGQKQLLSFARIFAHNPSIFILDEATANIDTNTERNIQKSVDIISKDKTSIFIAHRLSTIVNVDKIIVLDKGKIIETGNHNELLKKEGYYSKLYNSYYASLN